MDVKEDLLDKVVSELFSVLDYAEEVVEIIGRIQRQYNAGEDPELDSEIFFTLLSDIKAMEECVIKAEKLFNELRRSTRK